MRGGGMDHLYSSDDNHVEAKKEEEEVECSVCLESVIVGGERSTARLGCGHQFHLDCVGSAFNAKGAMQCPNCRRVEKGGNWLLATVEQLLPADLNMIPEDRAELIGLHELYHGSERRPVSQLFDGSSSGWPVSQQLQQQRQELYLGSQRRPVYQQLLLQLQLQELQRHQLYLGSERSPVMLLQLQELQEVQRQQLQELYLGSERRPVSQLLHGSSSAWQRHGDIRVDNFQESRDPPPMPHMAVHRRARGSRSSRRINGQMMSPPPQQQQQRSVGPWQSDHRGVMS